MTTPNPDSPPPPTNGEFSPRIRVVTTPAPFGPHTYFYIAFFAGAGALALIALLNLQRITVVAGLGSKTRALIAAMLVASLGFLVLSPASWWDPTTNIRLGVRVIAVLVSVGLYALHKGPALGTMQRHGDYSSVWKVIGQIALAAIAQGVVSSIVGLARGLIG